MRFNRKGFTLIELIIVVIIIGILAAIAAPMMAGNVQKARRSEAVAALGSIRTAARMYAAEHGGTYPASLAEINAYINGPGNPDLNGQNYNFGNYHLGAVAVNIANADGLAGTGPAVNIDCVTGSMNGN